MKFWLHLTDATFQQHYGFIEESLSIFKFDQYKEHAVAAPYADLPTLKSLKPEHLFMLCEWNIGEGPSEEEARSPTEGGSGGRSTP